MMTIIRNVFSSVSFNRISTFRTFSSNVNEVNNETKTKNDYYLNSEADKLVNEYYKITKIPRGDYISIQDYLMSQSENEYFHEQSLKHAFKN